MITPLVNEATWETALSHLPLWMPPAKRTVIVSPHPDDETLGCGGLIAAQRARGVEVIVAAITDGENAYKGVTGLAAVRREEQDSALALLGVERANIPRFTLPDSGVIAHKGKLIDLLNPLLDANTLIIAPWRGDFHPDHEACGCAAEVVAQQSGAQLVSYFFWTWHRGEPALLLDLPLRKFLLSDAQVDIKLCALAEHRSQLHHDGGEPILPDNLLGPARRNYEVFLVP